MATVCRLRLIGTSPTAGTASNTRAARSPAPRPRRREAPLPLDRERSGATEDTVLGIVKRIGEQVSRELAVRPFPVDSPCYPARSSGLHPSSGRSTFEALFDIERLDESVRVDARLPTRPPHRPWTFAGSAGGPPIKTGAAGSFQATASRLQGGADILDAVRERPVRSTTSTIGWPCFSSSTACTIFGGKGGFHLSSQYCCK
jgi:hypothetical protein